MTGQTAAGAQFLGKASDLGQCLLHTFGHPGLCALAAPDATLARKFLQRAPDGDALIPRSSDRRRSLGRMPAASPSGRDSAVSIASRSRRYSGARGSVRSRSDRMDWIRSVAAVIRSWPRASGRDQLAEP